MREHNNLELERLKREQQEEFAQEVEEGLKNRYQPHHYISSYNKSVNYFKERSKETVDKERLEEAFNDKGFSPT